MSEELAAYLLQPANDGEKKAFLKNRDKLIIYLQTHAPDLQSWSPDPLQLLGSAVGRVQGFSLSFQLLVLSLVYCNYLYRFFSIDFTLHHVRLWRHTSDFLDA